MSRSRYIFLVRGTGIPAGDRCLRVARPRRGFLMLDMVSGLMLMLAVLVMLAIVVGRSRLAATKLADQRTAVRLAEQAILELNAASGATTRPAAIPPNVSLHPASHAAPAGLRWVTVTASVNNRSATLTALVPESAAAPEVSP